MINISFYAGKSPYSRPSLVEFICEYNKLYDKGVKLFTKFNICNIYDGTCQRGRNHNLKNFCCYGCRHLSESGCIAKSLWCKLWLCGSGRNIANKIPEFIHKHKELITKAGRLCRGLSGRINISNYIYEFYYNRGG